MNERIVHVIVATDVGKRTIAKTCHCCGSRRPLQLGSLMGRVLPGDVGKRIIKFNGVLQVENDQQRDARIARTTNTNEETTP